MTQDLQKFVQILTTEELVYLLYRKNLLIETLHI